MTVRASGDLPVHIDSLQRILRSIKYHQKLREHQTRLIGNLVKEMDIFRNFLGDLRQDVESTTRMEDIIGEIVFLLCSAGKEPEDARLFLDRIPGLWDEYSRVLHEYDANLQKQTRRDEEISSNARQKQQNGSESKDGEDEQTAFHDKRMTSLDTRLAAMDKELVAIAKLFNMTVPDLIRRVAEIREEIERLQQAVGGNRVHQDALNPLALTYLVLSQYPDLSYRKIAELLGIKYTRVYGLVYKLEALGLTRHAKPFAEIEPLGEKLFDGSLEDV